MIRKGIGSGKLILFGEHSAVYGFPAIGTPLPLRTELSWIPPEAASNEQEDEPPNSAVKTPDEVGEDRVVFLKLLKKLQFETANSENFESGIWNRSSGIPRTGGFGSSAALCVAVSRVALNRPTREYDVEVHGLASRLEKLFHGKPSGIDTGMASDNGVSSWFRSLQGPPRRRAVYIPRWYIIYGAILRDRSTADSILQLDHRADKTPLEELGKIAANFLDIIAEGSQDENFASAASGLVNHAQEVLASLNLSNSTLDRIFELAKKHGADGGKLSGGGGGGAFFICARSRKIRNEILENLPPCLAEEGIKLSFPLRPLDFNGHPPESSIRHSS